jgi:hypothetical protein
MAKRDILHRRQKYLLEFDQAAQQIGGIFDYIESELFNFVHRSDESTDNDELTLLTYAKDILLRGVEDQIASYRKETMPRRWLNDPDKFNMSGTIMQRLVKDHLTRDVAQAMGDRALTITGIAGFVAHFNTQVRKELTNGNYELSDKNLQLYSRYKAIAISFTATALDCLSRSPHPLDDPDNRQAAMTLAGESLAL